MALFAQLTGNHQADWISFLSPSFRVMFDAATEELKEHPSAIVNDELRNAVDLFRLATDNMSEHKYDKLYHFIRSFYQRSKTMSLVSLHYPMLLFVALVWINMKRLCLI
jgi:hypothetical protein